MKLICTKRLSCTALCQHKVAHVENYVCKERTLCAKRSKCRPLSEREIKKENAKKQRVQIGLRMYDKTQRRHCIVIKKEKHKRLNRDWYVCNYGLFTRNVFPEELRRARS